MAIALRYVNEKGNVVESFLKVEHVTSTTASSLKGKIDAMLSKHGLRIFKCRRQGYDGASNMNIVGGSYKRHDALLKAQVINIFKAISNGELMTRKCLNQESSPARA